MQSSCKQKVTPTLNKFSSRLAYALHERGVSNSELARRVTVNPSTVSRWLESTRPLPAVVSRIAQALQVQEKWLVDGLGEMNQSDESLSESSKEYAPESRLTDAQAVIRSRLSHAHSGAPIQAVASRLSVEELEEMIISVVGRMQKESQPLIKLGYLTTIKACASDLERRLAEDPR